MLDKAAIKLKVLKDAVEVIVQLLRGACLGGVAGVVEVLVRVVVAVRVVVVMLVVTVVLLQRHFEDVTRQMVRSAAVELALVAGHVEAAPDVASARAAGEAIAAPRPWKARADSSMASFWANPPMSEATAKTSTPTMKISRRP